MLFPDHWANQHAFFVVVPTPVGVPCAWCDEPLAPGERGALIPHLGEQATHLAWHRRCFLRSILGPDVCSECSGTRYVWIQGNEWAPCLCGARSAR
jgi:hypothetical protein